MTDLGARRWRQQVTTVGPDGGDRADLLDPVALRAAAGDVGALDDLLWAVDELKLARRTIRRLVVADADAEEVEQDVLVAVAETIAGFRGEARFTTWLHQVARHKAIAALRRRDQATPLRDDDMGDAARISSTIATRTALDGAIGGLPDLYRDAVLLRDVERCPYAEVAARLGLNVNTAKSRVARGRALAAAALRDAR
ncbi:sigma-70 family RNA polymerase sigma factor [Iamia sp.]|uniref:RNA polymerase sigma factor n=1 Tax=Iamia sp. TaxID=2722710 RepID=UPI002CA0F9CF|nr:sigma-70 family RNA polymerase sigma factor [Iamia sp.]HXH59496.1 sigma-70 family RNA polymerase sigma factor [Iamia sp.]